MYRRGFINETLKTIILVTLGLNAKELFGHAGGDCCYKVNKSICDGGGHCQDLCLQNAIEFVYENGKRYSVINQDKCIRCGNCAKSCDALAIQLVKIKEEDKKK